MKSASVVGQATGLLDALKHLFSMTRQLPPKLAMGTHVAPGNGPGVPPESNMVPSPNIPKAGRTFTGVALAFPNTGQLSVADLPHSGVSFVSSVELEIAICVE